MNSESSYKAGKKEDVKFLQYYIAYLLAVLEYAQIWPAESFSLCKTLLSTGGTIIFISANFLNLLGEIVALVINNNIEMFANIIGVISMHSISLIKWCYCIRKKRAIIDLVKKLERCDVSCQRIDCSEEACQIYRNEMEYARRYSNFFLWFWMCGCIYGVLHWCLNPLFLKYLVADQMNSTNLTYTKRILPFIAWYPWDTDNMNNYICLYLLQIIGGISSAVGIVCYDAFYVIVLIIICAQFQHINTILMKSDYYECNNGTEAVFNLDRKLKNCVECHVEIIEFLKALQTFAGPPMFVQCIVTLLIICLVSFEASVIKIAADSESILKLWSLLEYLVVSKLELYIFCFIATRLEQLGTQIAYSIYFCGWEELMAFRRKGQSSFEKQLKYYDVYQAVQMMILRAQKPIVLTGGPFYTLSLQTFRAIVSMAISNSIFLRTVSLTDE